MKDFSTDEIMYGMRGNGPYWASRGGYPVSIDFLDIPRGEGRLADFGNLIKSAWVNVKRFVMPYLKTHGKEYAQKILELGATKASDYLEKSQKLGAATGLVTQALQDLPSVVTDIVARKIADHQDPLSRQEKSQLIGEFQRGGKMEEITQAVITQAMPYIKDAANLLEQKYQLIEAYADGLKKNTLDVESMKAYLTLQRQYKDSLMSDDDYAKAFFTEMMEHMILSAIQHADQYKLITPGSRLHLFTCGANKLKDKLAEHFEGAQYMTNRRAAVIGKKSPLCDGLCTLKQSDMDIDFSETRGGFPIAALASAAIPALMGLIPTIGQAISDWKRGSGYQDIDTDILPQLIANAIDNTYAKRSMSLPNARKTHSSLLAIAAPPKRRRR